MPGSVAGIVEIYVLNFKFKEKDGKGSLTRLKDQNIGPTIMIVSQGLF